jgi:hypothetical protein
MSLPESPREWTLAEAKEALETVAPLVAELRGLVARAAAEGDGNGNGRHASARHAAAAIIERLEGDGIVVRDPARGLIDFPARSPSGREYYLCWLDGEADIEWWHWVDAGFAGRTPLIDPPP